MLTTKTDFSIVVYGLGSRGKSIVDSLLLNNIKPALIIDKFNPSTEYKGIKVENLANVNLSNPLHNYRCILALHNNYVNLKDVYEDIVNAGITNISSLINISDEYDFINIDNGYWLEKDFKYSNYLSEIESLTSLLADNKSKELLKSIIQYRDLGSPKDCPNGSFSDEYIPLDLPRYSDPIRLIDCGSYDGLAIRKFIKAGYTFDSLISFEPDPKNYALLEEQDFNIKNSFFLPLGVWSSTTQLRFNSDKDMGSSVSESGDIVIQCVSIDALAKNYHPTLIKFDVEGAEIEALLGAKNTICANKPNLCISLYHRPDHLFKIPLLIDSWNLGYQYHLRVHEENTFGVVLYCLNPQLISH